MQETWVRSLGEEDPLEKEMATRSSILAWKFPWTEETGGLQSMGYKRVRRNLATKQQRTYLIKDFKDWQSTPVFLPGESRGQRSLAGYSLWGRK